MHGSSADVYEQVHAIFGAFLAGIIVPREGGLAIALTEKLEDMVSIIFLPLVSTSLPVMCFHAILMMYVVLYTLGIVDRLGSAQ